MKKLLLASVAVSGLALAAAPAYAEVNLELGGYFKGYGAYADAEDFNGTDARDFDFLRDTELHIGGETTLDNGLTVGAHFEFDVDGADGSAGVDESYVYFSGDWGRVNFGDEDGAAYLLQVAAPSADSNVDGLRQYISPIGTRLDYQHANSGKSTKLTYLSPIMSGFQVGLTYSPESSFAGSISALRNDDNGLEETFEGAVRYEGQFQNVGVIAGLGYSTTSNETTATSDDIDTLNVALDLDIAAFGIGAAYVMSNDTADNDLDTLVVGVDYTTGPFKIGASYLNVDYDLNDADTDRFVGGVTYNYGPGMSFRGSIQHVSFDSNTADADATAVLLGTQINF